MKWLRVLAFAVGSFLLPALGSGVYAACSTSYVGSMVINEYNYIDNFIELKLLTPAAAAVTTNFSGWTLTLDSEGRTTVKNVSSQYLVASSCGTGNSTYLRFNFASNEIDNTGIAVLRDAASNEVDYFRVSQTATYPSTPSTTCGAFSYPTDGPLNVSSANKGIARMPDGVGSWVVLPGTGAGSGKTLCGANDNLLALTKTASAPTITLGDNETFTVTVTNGLAGTQSGVVLDDLVPSAFQISSATVSAGSYDQSTGVWTIGSLAAGATATMTIVAKAVLAGTFTNTATVRSNELPVGWIAPKSATVTVVQPPPTLTKVASTSASTVGGTVSFTVTATNPVTAPMQNVVIVDTLPAGMTLAASAATLGTLSVAGQVITWTIPTLPASGSASLSLAVTVTQQGTLTNTVVSGTSSATASVMVLAAAVTHFRFDEAAGTWSGAANEALDSGGTNLHGRRLTTGGSTSTNTVSPSPTIKSEHPAVVGGFCNAGSFDGNAVIQVTDSPLFDYTTQLSASAWIYPTAAPSSDLYSILSNDINYEFHLNTSRRLYWWWGGGSRSLTSSAQIPLNQWTHIAITMDSATGRQRIYINGVADANTNNWVGTLTANTCPFYIGGDIATGAACSLLPARNFRGMIDEVKLYNFELSASEVQADMTLGRTCTGSFDHVRIEHDGSASTCAPESVTIKACLDAACTALYPGAVTVNLSPTGWVGGDTVNLVGGVASAQLSKTTAGTVTLGTLNSTPAANSATRCFNGATETCALTYAASSCAFDAVEPAALPQTRILTKLSGVPFNINVLALSAPTTINTSYTGTVSVDLVDSASCPSGAALTTPVSLTFAGGDLGRKNLTFTYGEAARSVKVRMQSGATAACSTDSFTIRPQSFALTSSMTNTGLSGTPKATAGTPFWVNADAGVGSGYTGTTPVIVMSKVKDHAGVPVAASALTGAFSAGDGAKAVGSAFRYLDVGNIQFDTDAVIDSSFSSVDQATDCVVGSTSNSLSGGKYGCDIGSVASAKFGRWHPNHFSFTGSLTPGCVGGNFTYMDNDALAVALTLKAHATTGAAASAGDPVTSRYTAGYPSLASVTVAGDNTGAAVAVSRLTNPPFPVMPNTALWTAGVFSINDTYAFAKLAAPDGAYDTFRLRTTLSDPDGQTFIGGAVPQDTGTTKIRNGRITLANAYGTELADLPLAFRAEYWTGTGWQINSLDSCTGDAALGAGNAVTLALTASSPSFSTCVMDTGAPGRSGAGCAAAATTSRQFIEGPVSGFAGNFNLWLRAPSTSGFVTISPTVPAWLGPVPAARATFGIYKNPVIYRREQF